jgi:AraC-like DNA-binding protein
LTRLPAPAAAVELVAWFWIPEWNLPEGVESRQPILGYPAANLVVEAGEVTLWGTTTRASERVLRGSGWAVGALLRPAALARLADAPHALVDTHAVLDAPELADAVGGAMPDLAAATAAVTSWLAGRIGTVTADGRLANAMADLMTTDATVLTVQDAARRMRVSVRTLQRLAHRAVGLPPAAIIRRRRLQEAAQRIREDPTVTLASVAAEIGYADQGHLARDFRAVLGLTASQYRAAAGA